MLTSGRDFTSRRIRNLHADGQRTGALKEYREIVLAEQAAYQKELAEVI